MRDSNSWKFLTLDLEDIIFQGLNQVSKISVGLGNNIMNLSKIADSTAEDFLFDDAESVLNYIEKKTLLLIHKVVIVGWLFLYCFSDAKIGIPNRVTFCIFGLYLIWKFRLISSSDLNKFTKSGIAEILIFLIFSNWVCDCSPLNSFLQNSSMMVLLPLSTSNTILQFIIWTLLSLCSLTKIHDILTSRTSLVNSLIMSFCYIMIISIIRKTSNSILTSLTNSRKKYQQESSNTNMYIASITHDLKNPLTSILGCLDDLKSSREIKASNNRTLLAATYSGQVLLYLINNILDISKIQCGKFEVERIPMGIIKVINKVTRIERELSRIKKLKLYTKVINHVPNFVYGDPMRFTQVLINLLGNSIKFTSNGYVAIVIDWAESISEIRDDLEFVPPVDFFQKETRRRNFYSNPEDSCRNYEDSDVEIAATQDINEEVNPGEQMAKYQLLSLLPLKKCKTDKKPNNYLNLHLDSPKNAKNQRIEIEEEEKQICLSCPPSPKNGSVKMSSESSDEEDISDRADVPSSLSRSGILVIDVIDTGIGITKEGIEKLFYPFSQANRNIRKQFGGTGLGLWITKQIVNSMSGIIEVRSEIKKGSRFRLKIPFNICSYDDVPKLMEEERKKPVRRNTKLNMACNAALIRYQVKYSLKGSKGLLKGMKIIILEDPSSPSDKKLENLFNLLQEDSCEILYATFNNALKVLIQEDYQVDVILIIAGTPTLRTKQAITNTLKKLEENHNNTMPFAVIADLILQSELGEFGNENIITFPYQQEAVFNALLKMKMRMKRRSTCGGKYGSIIEEMYQKYNVKVYNPCKSIKLILADDEGVCQMAVKSMIEHAGDYEVFAYFNGSEAIKCYEEKLEEIRIIILDLVMPEMSGIETALRIRLYEKAINKKRVPIVGLTAHESKEIKDECLASGMDIILSKPIEKHKLINILQKYA